MVLALKYHKRVQARISTRTKAEARTEKERVRKVLILNLDFQLWKHPVNKDMAIPGNRTIGLPAIGLTIPQPQLLGAAELCLCNRSFVFAKSERETCWESCIFHAPTTTPHYSRVYVLETGDVPILFSPPQKKNLGITLELDPKGAEITCPACGLYSSPAEYSTKGTNCIGLDEPCVPAQIA